MNIRSLITPVLVVAATLAVPSATQAQADWTIIVPLQVGSLPEEMEAGAVVCMVTPRQAQLSPTNARTASLAGGLTLSLQANPVSPGEPFPFYEGVDYTNGEYVGYQTFSLDANGNGPSSVTVEVRAHPDADTGQKVAVIGYVCSLGLRPAGTPEWLTTDPSENTSGFAQIMTPADPSAVVYGVVGTFPGG